MNPEVCALRWDQVDFEHGLLHVRRIKNGMPSVHPLGGGELRTLRKLQREAMPSRYVFTAERRAPPVSNSEWKERLEFKQRISS